MVNLKSYSYLYATRFGICQSKVFEDFNERRKRVLNVAEGDRIESEYNEWMNFNWSQQRGRFQII